MRISRGIGILRGERGKAVFKSTGFHGTGFLQSIKRRVKESSCLQNLHLCNVHSEKVKDKISDYLTEVSLYDQFCLRNRSLENNDTRNKTTKKTARKKHYRRVGVSSEDLNNFSAEFQLDDDGALPGTSS